MKTRPVHSEIYFPNESESDAWNAALEATKLIKPKLADREIL